MRTLSIREMRNQLGNLVALVAEDHELIVTRHNRLIARILPIREKLSRPNH